MRARRPRPYLDNNKETPNRPEYLVGTTCQGRGKTGGFPARYNPVVENDNFAILGKKMGTGVSYFIKLFPPAKIPG